MTESSRHGKEKPHFSHKGKAKETMEPETEAEKLKIISLNLTLMPYPGNLVSLL